MKKLILALVATVLLSMSAMAQAATANGSLQVTATVASSITLVIDSGTAGPALTNAGTANASVTLGTISAYGTTAPAGTTYTAPAGGTFAINVPFALKVTLWNGGLTKYDVNASLQTADTNNTWSIGGTSFTTTAAKVVSASTTFGSDTQQSLKIQIPSTLAAGTITNTINFAVTAS